MGAWAELVKTHMERLPEFARGHRMALGETTVELLEDAGAVTSWTGGREEPKVAPDHDWTALAALPETFHRPVLELAVPATVAGDGLFVDKVLTWSQYAKLLDVLAEVGIIEEGYRQASYAREFTSVRLPWVAKESKVEGP